MLLVPSPQLLNTTPVPLHCAGTGEAANIPGTLGWILPRGPPGAGALPGLRAGKLRQPLPQAPPPAPDTGRILKMMPPKQAEKAMRG